MSRKQPNPPPPDGQRPPPPPAPPLPPVRSEPLLAALRTLERSFRQRSAYSHSRAKKNSDHGQYLIGIHVGICADDLRDLIKQYTANKVKD